MSRNSVGAGSLWEMERRAAAPAQPASRAPSLESWGVPAPPAPRYVPPPPDTRENSPERDKAYGGFFAAFVLTAVALYLYHDRQSLLDDLAVHGRHANGVVTAAVRRGGRGGPSYHLKFQYVLPSGVYTGSKQVSRTEAEQSRPGDYVDVLYSPASPARHIAAAMPEARKDLKVGASIGSGVLAWMWGWSLWQLSRVRRVG